MKTKKSNPKIKLLLGTGLDTLHFESQEWLETIAFWKDEARFFEDLLKKKELKEKSQNEYTKLLQELDKIHADLFSDIEDSIMKHERLLSRIEKGEKGLSDGNYREEHGALKGRMYRFDKDFRMFKKIVFDYVKKS